MLITVHITLAVHKRMFPKSSAGWEIRLYYATCPFLFKKKPYVLYIHNNTEEKVTEAYRGVGDGRVTNVTSSSISFGHRPGMPSQGRQQ